MKRIFDFALALVMLIFCLPVFFAYSLYYFVHEGSSALYKEERIGRNNKRIRLYRFKRMDTRETQ